ncbi:hypothetical protein LTS08_007349 [Lithohypha guttulata]|nr:hypothetical protein LTS08_007349 [Lithohypha guttulata]
MDGLAPRFTRRSSSWLVLEVHKWFHETPKQTSTPCIPGAESWLPTTSTVSEPLPATIEHYAARLYNGYATPTPVIKISTSRTSPSPIPSHVPVDTNTIPTGNASAYLLIPALILFLFYLILFVTFLFRMYRQWGIDVKTLESQLRTRSSEVDALSANLNGLQDVFKQSNDDLSAAKKRLEATGAQLDLSEQAAKELDRAIERGEMAVTSCEDQLAELKAESDEGRKVLQRQQKEMKAAQIDAERKLSSKDNELKQIRQDLTAAQEASKRNKLARESSKKKIDSLEKAKRDSEQVLTSLQKRQSEKEAQINLKQDALEKANATLKEESSRAIQQVRQVQQDLKTKVQQNQTLQERLEDHGKARAGLQKELDQTRKQLEYERTSNQSLTEEVGRLKNLLSSQVQTSNDLELKYSTLEEQYGEKIAALADLHQDHYVMLHEYEKVKEQMSLMEKNQLPELQAHYDSNEPEFIQLHLVRQAISKAHRDGMENVKLKLRKEILGYFKQFRNMEEKLLVEPVKPDRCQKVATQLGHIKDNLQNLLSKTHKLRAFENAHTTSHNYGSNWPIMLPVTEADAERLKIEAEEGGETTIKKPNRPRRRRGGGNRGAAQADAEEADEEIDGIAD